jgi:pimeloyl-ACP methyl ester carboxylesterase
MSPPITRHFVTVGNRRVHYRRAGEGPPIVLLHASPVSSEVYELQIGIYAKHFTAIALDTPGYGLSDPLDHPQPEIEDFADAVAETLDALGIQQCATYGRHTGGSIAVEFAHRHPDRCALALTDGYPVFSDKTRDEYLEKYLNSITPEWDGTHLLWLWFRYREQHVFWPWYKHLGAHRADQDVPDNNFLHRGVKEILMAGNGYKVAYSAAFRHKALDHLAEGRLGARDAAREDRSHSGRTRNLPEASGARGSAAATRRDAAARPLHHRLCALRRHAVVHAPDGRA